MCDVDYINCHRSLNLSTHHSTLPYKFLLCAHTTSLSIIFPTVVAVRAYSEGAPKQTALVGCLTKSLGRSRWCTRVCAIALVRRHPHRSSRSPPNKNRSRVGDFLDLSQLALSSQHSPITSFCTVKAEENSAKGATNQQSWASTDGFGNLDANPIGRTHPFKPTSYSAWGLAPASSPTRRTPLN